MGTEEASPGTLTRILVVDPHDEYYGRNTLGLKDHPKSKEKLVYYTPKNPPAGCKTLRINIKNINPAHFNGVLDWSQPQQDCISMFHKQYGNKWIEALVLEQKVEGGFGEATISVVRRRVMNLLDMQLRCPAMH